MKVLVIGTPDSGKSQKAESIAVALSQGKERYYIATMIPYGDEGKKRVEKHKKLREGKGFITIECPVRVHEALEKDRDFSSCTGLLECMSNLVGNEMYDDSRKENSGKENSGKEKSDDELANYIVDSVMELSERLENLVIVSNRFPLEDRGYDDETKRYVRLIQTVNERLVEKCDSIYKIIEGEWSLRENN